MGIVNTDLFPKTGRWLASRNQHEEYHVEWEQFYKANKSIVPVLLGSVGELRANMLKAKLRGQGKSKPVGNSLTVRDHSITFSQGDREVQILLRTYVPDTIETNLPGMLYFHGGGWALGDLDGEDRFCRLLCSKVRLVVVSVDYRLAPENPYPAQLNDAWAALDWAIKDHISLKLDVDKILIGGTSAGANIAAVVCQDSKQRGLQIRGQLLRIPVDPAILTPECMKQFLRWYNPADASHVTVSPLLAPRFDELPPTFFQICGKDPLRDEGLAYADALESAGVPVKVKVYPGLPHAFWIFPDISTTQIAEDDLLEGVKWLVKQISA
ncbi:uncharacterized protein TRUGW13939_10004 [Talaromyces rugulosus]|uniref:Alpha/beta hydrolase fold-3 domain-containing protein n=1 Tax=Talaromyces rugulosus TaxID=121627 RepID=A0A7H8R8V1_TALRU|nr:uncharacterized protein TRUGW13939_10004 [Talaromyces rugulosus]QKX62839.1 hypothetical protein TRUGW13939_10004 [Talaromyces rugulosus]